MDILNYNLTSLLPTAIDAFSFVYGEEYRSIITKRLSHTIIIQYEDINGLKNYISFLEKCKARELSIRFLDEIGIDVKNYPKDNYADEFDEKIKVHIDGLLRHHGFSKLTNFATPLLAFEKNDYDIDTTPNKIRIINYLLGDNHEKITEDNLKDFIKTEEFLETLKKIDEYKIVYKKLFSEYMEWTKQFSAYFEYIIDEYLKEKGVLQEKKNELYEEIYDELPTIIKEAIFNKTVEKQQNAIFGNSDISENTNIEYFNKEKMEMLKSPDLPMYQKKIIIDSQAEYLKELGIVFPNNDMLKCNTEEDINNYLSFINQDNVKKYIPTEELLSTISSLREKKYEEAIKKYRTNKKDFLDAMKIFNNKQDFFEFIYNNIKSKLVCIASQGITDDNNEFHSLMFYTIRENDGGYLQFNYLHECGHIADNSKKGSGFESDDDFRENGVKNKYDKAFRKYEKFNETLNDIFTIEAIEYLKKQGIYLIEPKEYTKTDLSNYNTALITKNLLKPLVERFRNQVIKAKINVDPHELTKYIGEENFEELVDAVNKVDYLSRNGVIGKIEKKTDDPMVKEYYEQVDRVKKIYINIDKYYENVLANSELSEVEEIVSKRCL